MFTRRGRDALTQKTDPTQFAARAKDLVALRDAVVDAAAVGAGFWISYLFALFYFAVAAGAVTHRDLLLESPVKLPFLNVELPLEAFFVLAPFVFLIVHAYVLLHLVFSAGKVGAFNAELQAQVLGDDARARLRGQLPSNIFVQSVAGPPAVRTVTIRVLMWLITRTSLVLGPIALLTLFQLQFLPYHSEWITCWQRILVVIDIALLWILWPSIALGETARRGWKDYRRLKVRAGLLVAILPSLLVATIATFPGERLEKKLGPVPGWATLHELLLAGGPDFVTQKPRSLWSNVLVLPNFEAGDVKFDAPSKIAISSEALSLRGRSLEGAVLAFAHLRNADFTGASLVGANFTGADLRETKFECARTSSVPPGASQPSDTCVQLQGALFESAQLQGASLQGARLQGAKFSGAQLQGASLFGAQLQNAQLTSANLQGAILSEAFLPGVNLNATDLRGASLHGAQLQGAMFLIAHLEGASLNSANLQGAYLHEADLKGAELVTTQLQGAVLGSARLEGAVLSRIYVWRTDPPDAAPRAFFAEPPEPAPIYYGSGLDCYPCDWSETSYRALKSLIDSVQEEDLRVGALLRIAVLEKPPYVVDEGSAKAWADLEKKSARSADSHFDTLANVFKEIGCLADGAPSVINALVPQLTWRFEGGNPSKVAEIAAAFLDEAKCPGARGLSEEKRAKLQELRDRGLPHQLVPAPRRNDHRSRSGD